MSMYYKKNNQWNPGVGGPDFIKTVKCYLKVSEFFYVIRACTYYLDTYLCQFSTKNTIVYDLTKKRKWNLVFLWTVQIQSLLLGYFVFSAQVTYFLYFTFKLDMRISAYTYTHELCLLSILVPFLFYCLRRVHQIHVTCLILFSLKRNMNHVLDVGILLFILIPRHMSPLQIRSLST
jgi:hypothetical protein